jgi:hypothetical protein
MHVCYFYSELRQDAVNALPADAEKIDTSKTSLDYWSAIKARWNAGNDLLFVEHDIQIHGDVIQELLECDGDWCVFPYRNGVSGAWWNGDITASDSGFLLRSLGCTRFSARIQAMVPVLDIQQNGAASSTGCLECRPPDFCWCHVDGPINIALSAITEPHIHPRPVEHLKPLGLANGWIYYNG